MFCSMGDMDHWMGHTGLRLWGDRTLRQLCIPASHDSGMWKLPWSTNGASEATVITQRKTILDQLNLGVRWFDIRPVYHKGQWVCGHYTWADKLSSWQGGEGEGIDEMVVGINAFTDRHSELIVLDVSHVYSIRDVPPADLFRKDDFQAPTATQWSNLHKKLQNLSSRCGLPSGNLTAKMLKEFIGPSGITNSTLSAVLVLFEEAKDNAGRVISVPSGHLTHGMYLKKDVWPFESSDWDPKKDSQRLQAFRNQASQSDAKPYCYAGYHSMSDGQAIDATARVGETVVELSDDSMAKLFTELFPACTETLYPAALMADGVRLPDLTALCLALNCRGKKPKTSLELEEEKKANAQKEALENDEHFRLLRNSIRGPMIAKPVSSWSLWTKK